MSVMNLAGVFDGTLQVIAAFMIFVAAYLAFFMVAIVCLVAAQLIAERASLMKKYELKPLQAEARAWPGAAPERRKSSRYGLVFHH